MIPDNTRLQSHQTQASSGEESLSSMAIAATATALRLWAKLLLSILIPATDHSLVYAKEGWSALEPSIRQSAFWFIYDGKIVSESNKG